MEEQQPAVRVYAPLKALQGIETPELPFMEARAGLAVDNWIGMPVAPQQIKVAPGHSTTLVLADDVEFPKRSYSFSQGSAPKHIILIANTIRLTGHVTFFLQGRNGSTLEERSGGHVTIISRHFICEKGGLLYIASYGQSPSGGAGGHGGNINLVVEQADVQQSIDARLDAISEYMPLAVCRRETRIGKRAA
jgi:hypothetical protein